MRQLQDKKHTVFVEMIHQCIKVSCGPVWTRLSGTGLRVCVLHTGGLCPLDDR